MRWNSVLREDVEYEKPGKFSGGNGVMGRDENCLLGESVHDDEDSGVAGRGRELLDEVRRNRVPGLLWNRQLLECSIRLVPGYLGMSAASAGLTKFPNKAAECGPGVISADELKCLVTTEVASKWVIVLVLEDPKAEEVGVWYIDAVVLAK